VEHQPDHLLQPSIRIEAEADVPIPGISRRTVVYGTRDANKIPHACAKLSELQNGAIELRDKGALDEEECFIDATFVMAKGGGTETGATKPLQTILR